MDEIENMDWEATPEIPDNTAEIKQIRKSLRKRSALIVLTSLVLVAALFFAAVRFGIPALEATYWDPNTSTYVEGMSDLELTMTIYTDLFCPRDSLMTVEFEKNGFATYEIHTIFDTQTYNRSSFNEIQPPKSSTLIQNELKFPQGFWDYNMSGPFNTGLADLKTRNEPITKTALSTLREYPDYVMVYAAVTFPEDLTLDELTQLHTSLRIRNNAKDRAAVIWAAIRNGQDGVPQSPCCGYKPDVFRYVDTLSIASDYPNLIGKDRFQNMEQHFKSMLQYQQDQLDKGTGLLPPDCYNENYYTDVLNYVEENGVMAYGAYVIATPDILVELYETNRIDNVYLCDAWITY